MKEYPIIFSAPMVLANHAGHKSMTRRVMKSQPVVVCGEYYFYHRGKQYKIGCVDSHQDGSTMYPLEMASFITACCPYGQPGDRLWQRERWATSIGCDKQRPSILETPGNGYGWPVWYSADDAVWWRGADKGGPAFMNRGRWRASFHMPRWASRSLYDVLEVRAERLQAITEADAIAEGVEQVDHVDGEPVYRDYFEDGYAWSAVESYKSLWDHLHGFSSSNAWYRNPWVWVVRYAPAKEGTHAS